MADWLPGGRERSRRLETLERDVQRLQTQSEAQAKAAGEAVSDLKAMADRLSGIAETLEAMALSGANQASALNLATAELERLRNLPASVLELETRLAKLEDVAGPKAAKSAEERAKAEGEALIKMRAAIQRAELQLEAYAEEGRKTGAALLERIESMRTGRPAKAAPAEAEQTGG